MTDVVYSVNGMSCDHCRRAVEHALKAVPDVLQVQVDVVKGIARVHSERELAEEAIRVAIEDAGYEFLGKA